MGGGGNVFKQVANAVAQAVGDVVNTTKKTVVGGSDVMPTPSSQKRDAENTARQAADSRAKMAEAQATAEGGTPTAYASQQARSAAGSASALSGSQQAVNQSAGSGTMLTGTEGVDPQKLELGKQTLLGG